MFSESPTTSQVHLKKTFQFSSFHQAKKGRSMAISKGWEGIKLASEQSFVVIGYEVQKYKQKLDYLDEDRTGLEAIELAQEDPKKTNPRKL